MWFLVLCRVWSCPCRGLQRDGIPCSESLRGEASLRPDLLGRSVQRLDCHVVFSLVALPVCFHRSLIGVIENSFPAFFLSFFLSSFLSRGKFAALGGRGQQIFPELSFFLPFFLRRGRTSAPDSYPLKAGTCFLSWAETLIPAHFSLCFPDAIYSGC